MKQAQLNHPWRPGLTQVGFVPLLLALGLSLACGLLPARQTEKTSRLATRTPLPTFTPSVGAELPLSIPPTAQPTPTLPPPPMSPVDTPPPQPAAAPTLPADTPTPEPPTPVPPTEAPPPAQPQAAPPTEAPPPAAPAQPVAGAHGVIGQITFRDGRNTYGVGEKVFVKIEATNTTAGILPFGVLGLVPSTGAFQTSWSDGTLEGSKPFHHEDGLAFGAPGTYKLWLSICFSTKDVCMGPNGDWERFEPGLDVTIQ